MTLASLSDVLVPARDDAHAVAGLVVLGWEDALAFVHAAERANAPLILQAGPGCRKHTPLPVLGAMFRHLAEVASVPIVAHLDHATTLEVCEQALDAGFTSIMYDGSRKPFEENVRQTAAAANLARKYGASCEGELGFVGYAEGEASHRTNPKEAALFAEQTGVDALAVSVGNVHLQQEKSAEIDFDAIRAIEALTDIPLVLHGGSGIDASVRSQLARETNVSKFNIGTELRMTFGAALRKTLIEDAEVFDRIAILSSTLKPMEDAAFTIIESLAKP